MDDHRIKHLSRLINAAIDLYGYDDSLVYQAVRPHLKEWPEQTIIRAVVVHICTARQGA